VYKTTDTVPYSSGFYRAMLAQSAGYAERGDATVSRLSVRLSVRNDQVPCSNRFEFFENNFTAK